MANKGIRKIQEMNAWRKELSAKGVDVPRGTSYEELKKLHKKNCGCSTRSRKSRSSRSSRGSKSRSRSREQTQRVLWGWTV